LYLERPIPSWKALEWLVEDYQLLNERYDRVYQYISSGWQESPPVSVVTNNHFCPCKRRYKWNPKATIDSIDYNLPEIPKAFDSVASCARSYGSFYEEYITHTDPVYFRAAVFCDFLRMMCEIHGIIVNVSRL